MISIMKLIMKSGFMIIFVNVRSWAQLLVIVTVISDHEGADHEGFSGEFRG